jgi:hypothetical protein
MKGFLSKNASVFISLAAVTISISGLSFTIFSAVVTQRAYLSYSLRLDEGDLTRARSEIGSCDLDPKSNVLVAPKNKPKPWQGLFFKVILKTTNFGNTPASNVLFHLQALSDWTSPPQDIAVQPILVDMAPKEATEFQGFAVFLRPKSLGVPKAGNCPIINPIIRGTASYNDEFGLPHADSLCYSITIGIPDAPISTCQKQEVPTSNLLFSQFSN